MAKKSAPTPGSILQNKFMKEYKLEMKQLADGTGISGAALKQIIDGNKKLTPDAAMRLAKFFSNKPEFWLEIQYTYDLGLAAQDMQLAESLKKIQKAKKPVPAKAKPAAAKKAAPKKAAAKKPAAKKPAAKAAAPKKAPAAKPKK